MQPTELRPHRPRHGARGFSLLMIGLGLLWLAGPAHAAPDDAFKAIGEFERAMVDVISKTVADPQSELRRIADQLFAVLALSFFIWKAAGWALRGFSLHDGFFTVAQIATIGGLMGVYPVLVPAIFGATEFIANAIMGGILGVDMTSHGDAALPIAMVELLSKSTFTPDCGPAAAIPGACLVVNLEAILAAILMSILIALLAILSIVVDVWGFWGFAIAMAIGILLVPFALYQRMSFLMDGWLRFFIGFMVYVIVAKANLALVAFALLSYLGHSTDVLLDVANLKGFTPAIHHMIDILGMSLFVGVGLFSLVSTGAFARAIVAGAGGNGVNFGAIVRGVVGSIAGAAVLGFVAVRAGSAASKEAQADGKNAAQATLAGAKAALKAAGSKTVDQLARSNASFRAGMTVGREAFAGAQAGAARGLKFGADAAVPTGGGTPRSSRQRAQAVVGAVLGGAGAAASTTFKQAVGIRVEDSAKNAQRLTAEKDRGAEEQARSSDYLDAREDLSQGERTRLESSLAQLTATMGSGALDEVRAAREATRATRAEVDTALRERADIARTGQNAVSGGVQAFQYVDRMGDTLSAPERERIATAANALDDALGRRDATTAAAPARLPVARLPAGGDTASPPPPPPPAPAPTRATEAGPPADAAAAPGAAWQTIDVRAEPVIDDSVERDDRSRREARARRGRKDAVSKPRR